MAGRLIDGRSVMIPRQLKDELPSYSRRVEGQETAALIWNLIRNEEIRRNGKASPIHSHHGFGGIGQHSTVKRAKDWLRDQGFIRFGQSYQVGSRSIHYSTVIRANPVELVMKKKSAHCTLRNFTANDAACRYTREMLNAVEVDVPAAKGVLSTAMIDHISDNPLGEGSELVEWSRKGSTWVSRNDKRDPKIEDMYGLATPVAQLIHKSGRVFRGRKGNRLFSPLTQLKRDFRACLSFFGEPLASIDMVCCQPTLLGHLTEDEKLVRDCVNNVFYDNIATDLGVERDEAKEIYCEFAYGKNRHRRNSNREALQVQKLIANKYPRTSRYVWKAKELDHSKFSHKLQQFEAALFVDGSLMEMKKAGIPALTVHDCIFVPESFRAIAEKMAVEKMNREQIKARFKEG